MKIVKYYELTDIITFGKYKGDTIQDIIECDVEYVTWLKNNVENFKLEEKAKKLYKKTKEKQFSKKLEKEYDRRNTLNKDYSGNYAQRSIYDPYFNDSNKEETTRISHTGSNENVTYFSDGSSVVHHGGPVGDWCYDENGEEC